MMTRSWKLLSEIEDPSEIEVLYWVGCAAAVDERLQGVARAVVDLMGRAGVRFALLGPEERCSGDPARRTGNEFHFDMLARENIEILNRYGVKAIVTHCPHCLHTFRNEYPLLGGNYDVVHHSQFILDLIREGRLKLKGELKEKIAFHDPCYLGRHNGIFDPPRELINLVSTQRVELPRARERSFCCGAGGGHAFFEDESEGKVNVNRSQEALDSKASVLCTACPFCLSMMEEGVNSLAASERLRVRDLAELVRDLLDDPASI